MCRASVSAVTRDSEQHAHDAVVGVGVGVVVVVVVAVVVVVVLVVVVVVVLVVVVVVASDALFVGCILLYRVVVAPAGLRCGWEALQGLNSNDVSSQ